MGISLHASALPTVSSKSQSGVMPALRLLRSPGLIFSNLPNNNLRQRLDAACCPSLVVLGSSASVIRRYSTFPDTHLVALTHCRGILHKQRLACGKSHLTLPTIATGK